MKFATTFLAISLQPISAFVSKPSFFSTQFTATTSSSLSAARVGIFFGTSTGSTESAAYEIAETIGGEGPFDVDSIENLSKNFDSYDALIVGTPTWNTGADTERSGTGWDELYYDEMQTLSNLSNKKVAVFGLGDSVSYSENYADASGELHDVFEKLGCKMYGYVSQDGYEHDASKAIRGDKFCGLLLDAVNQEELTTGRIENWVSQLKLEGFLEAGDDNVVATTVVETVATETTTTTATPDNVFTELERLEEENAQLRSLLEKNAPSLTDENGYVPHTNPKSGQTMWVSPDGRTCYYTAAALIPKTSVNP